MYRNEWEGAPALMLSTGELAALPTFEKSDRITAQQLTIWMKEMKHGRGYSDGAVTAVVTAWRTGTLPWGALWHGAPLSPPLGSAPVPALPSPDIRAGVLASGKFALVGAALLGWFLLKGRR